MNARPFKVPVPLARKPPPPPKPTSRRGLLGAIGAAVCAGGALLIPGKAAATQEAVVDDSRTCRNAKEVELLLAWRSIDRSEMGDGWTEKSRDSILGVMRSLAADY
jgi:hypothetical protein